MSPCVIFFFKFRGGSSGFGTFSGHAIFSQLSSVSWKDLVDFQRCLVLSSCWCLLISIDDSNLSETPGFDKIIVFFLSFVT